MRQTEPPGDIPANLLYITLHPHAGSAELIGLSVCKSLKQSQTSGRPHAGSPSGQERDLPCGVTADLNITKMYLLTRTGLLTINGQVTDLSARERFFSDITEEVNPTKRARTSHHDE